MITTAYQDGKMKTTVKKKGKKLVKVERMEMDKTVKNVEKKIRLSWQQRRRKSKVWEQKRKDHDEDDEIWIYC